MEIYKADTEPGMVNKLWKKHIVRAVQNDKIELLMQHRIFRRTVLI